MADLKWWQTAVFYQIYPRNFAEGNGDGIGDFIGMTERLDYLADFGIDTVWLSPHFPSPKFRMPKGETVFLETLKIAPFEIFVGELRSTA